MTQDLFNLVCLQRQKSASRTLFRVKGESQSPTDLLDSDADSDRVDGALDQNLLFVVTADNHRLEEQLFTTSKTTNKPHNTQFLMRP